MKRIIFYFLFFLGISFQAIGQNPITITKLSTDSIIIGETITLTLSLHQNLQLDDANLVLDFNTIENLAYEQDTNFFEKTADIEIIDEGIISKYIRDKKVEVPLRDIQETTLPWEADIELGIYSIGAFNFPMPYIIRHSGDTLKANVGNFLIVQPPPGFGQDSTKVINEIKPIIEIPTSWEDYLSWIYIILGLIVFGLFGYWFSKRKSKQVEPIEPAPEPVVVEPAHVIALRALQKLKSEALWTKDEVKQYQSELTMTIRQYLENRYGINALEMTTGEIISAIEKEQSMQGQSEALINILTVADLVKFAKAKPSAEVHEAFLDTAFEFVNQTKLETNAE